MEWNEMDRKMDQQSGKKIQAVIFDMDGVLFDTERVVQKCWLKIAEEKGLHGIEEILPKCLGLSHPDTKVLMEQKYGKDFDYDKFRKYSGELYYAYLDEYGLPIKPGMYEILDFLKKNQYPIGLASSSRRENVMGNLKRSGAEAYFDAIICGDMVTRSKPDPEIYRIACDLVSIQPEHVLAVEDSLNGIRSAHAAGMPVVMIPDLIKPEKEALSMVDAVLKELTDIEEWIQNQNG